MTSTILHAKVRRPENKLAGVVLSRRRSCRRTILQPRRFVFAAEVRAGRPEVGVCFPRRFAGGREGLACRRNLACRGGSCSPWRFDGGHEGWRVLLAEVVTDHREGRRSSSSRSFVLPRRFVFAVEVRLAAEVVADDREGLARRGGSSCCGGCYRRLRGSGSSRSFSLPRRFVFAVEVRLTAEVVADDREGPA